MLANGIETLFVMLILMAIGWLMSYLKWINQDIKEFLNKLVIKISVPALVVYNFFGSFDYNLFQEARKYIILVIFLMIILYVISSTIGKIIKLNSEKRGNFIAMSTVSNSIFFGLPINLGLFGEESLPYILLYYIGNTIIFWGLCNPRIIGDVKKDLNWVSIQKILSPPLVTLLVSGILLYINYQPPSIIIEVARNLSGFVTPLSLIITGKIIYDINFKEYEIDKSIFLVILIRLILAPSLMHVLANGFSLPQIAINVFTIQAAMPVMTQIILVSEIYGKDSKYVATGLSLTTLLSLFFIPLYMILLN